MIPSFTLPSKWALNSSLLLFLLVTNGLLPQTLTAQCLTYQTTGLYSFTVPAGGPFQITVSARGGDGYGNGSEGNESGGGGATAKATFAVQAGDVLTSIVGDNGVSFNNSVYQGGGGGGSAVILNRNGTLSLLVAAGGGGGNGRLGLDAVAGGGGQGSGPATGGAGGDINGYADGGGGGGGLNGPGVDGAANDFPRNGAGGGQASLTALSAGGSSIFNRSRLPSGGAGFGGGGGAGNLGISTGGGGGGYGGGNAGTSSSASQGGYSFINAAGSTSSITPGVSGGSQLQDGSVVITFPASPVSAAITGSNTSSCAGQSTTITGTVNAVGPWTIVFNDGTTRSGTGPTFSIPVTPPSSTTYSIQCLFDSRGVAQPGNVSGSQVVVVNPPVTITQQPASSSSVCAGTNVTTFVSTSGTVSGYQWYRNGGQVSGQTSATLSLPNTTTANSGSYVVVVTGCNSATSTAFNLTVNPPPTVSLSNNGPLTCAQTSVTITASGTSGATYAFSGPNGPLAISGNTASVSGPGTYTVTASLNGCTSTTTTTVSSNTVTPTVSISPSTTVICAGQTATFTASGNPASYSWSSGQTSAMISATAQGAYSVTATNTSNGCSTTATAQLTVNPIPTPPTITTQAGGPYPAGQSNLTISQNTGNVILGVSGCAGGTISWSGGSSSTLSVSTTNTGVQTFTTTCTNNACTSPTATATVTVVAPTLKVLSRDPDNGQLNNNTIKPYLLLQNAGTTPIAYSTITLRYWLTTENNIPLNFQKNYVQIGQGNLNLRYVSLNPARQGATGYIEYSFSAGAGSLAPNGDSGPLEVQVTKQDYSVFNQRDDYSYINNSSFTLNPRITAYQNGVIFYGQEPTGTGSARTLMEEVATLLQVKVLGNPVVGQSAEVEIRGVSGQAVQLKLVDLQGKTLHGQSIKEAGSVERVSLPLGNAQGILLLDVSTATQRQQIKLLRP